MANKLYVGRLPYETDEAALQELFAQAGEVEAAVLIKDRETGNSKGFGFVTMATDEGAAKAIEMFNDYEMGKMRLVVNEARPMEERKPFNNDRNSGGGNFNRNSY